MTPGIALICLGILMLSVASIGHYSPRDPGTRKAGLVVLAMGVALLLGEQLIAGFL